MHWKDYNPLKTLEGRAIASEDARSKYVPIIVQHEALIPIIQADVKELKDGQRDIQRDIKEILKAVKS